MISTGLLHAMFGIEGASTEHGARNVVDAALSPDVRSGQYLDDGTPATPGPTARDRAFQARLHEVASEVLRPWR